MCIGELKSLMHLELTFTICGWVMLGWNVAQKSWTVRTCVALSVLCLFIVSSYVYGLWQVRYYYVEYRLERPLELWALFWVSALLLVMASVPFGISRATFWNLRAMRFRSVQFIVSATNPLLACIHSGSEAKTSYRTVVCPSCKKMFSEEHHQCPWCGKRLPKCKRCGKHISGLEAEKHKNYCIECYRQWLRERPPFF